jgi:hypothetical protein
MACQRPCRDSNFGRAADQLTSSPAGFAAGQQPSPILQPRGCQCTGADSRAGLTRPRPTPQRKGPEAGWHEPASKELNQNAPDPEPGEPPRAATGFIGVRLCRLHGIYRSGKTPGSPAGDLAAKIDFSGFSVPIAWRPGPRS